MPDFATAIGLWLAVVLSGLYHGLNPGMGWPLAVSAGLMERSRKALFQALLPLWFGHIAAMAVVLLPFGLMTGLIEWQWHIRLVASILVIGAGLFLVIFRRHPRFLARIPPSRLALWSFAIAMAHGAGLMLLPVYLGLCGLDGAAGEDAIADLMASSILMATIVALVHSVAMIAAGGAMAFSVYEWLGLTYISRTWLNLDLLWAISLILVGTVALTVLLLPPT